MFRAAFAILLLFTCVGLAVAAEPESNRYLVLSTARAKTLNAELDAALSSGFSLVAGEPASNLLVLERRPASPQRKYKVERRLLEAISKRSYQGYRILPWSFSHAEQQWAAIFESLKEGEAQPEYRVSATALTRDLQRDIARESAAGFRAIALAGLEGQGAVLERNPGSSDAAATYELLATKKFATMEKAIADTAGRGYKVVAATGAGHEVLILMESQPEKAPKREYKVTSTTRSSTFEKELNDAAAQGYRIVPLTGAGLRKSGLLTVGATAYEQAIVMEKIADAPPMQYRYIGARREKTLEKELNASPATCSIATMFLTFQEVAVLLACPSGT